MLKSVLVNWQSDKNRGKEFLLYMTVATGLCVHDSKPNQERNYEIHNTKHNFPLNANF